MCYQFSWYFKEYSPESYYCVCWVREPTNLFTKQCGCCKLSFLTINLRNFRKNHLQKPGLSQTHFLIPWCSSPYLRGHYKIAKFHPLNRPCWWQVFDTAKWILHLKMVLQTRSPLHTDQNDTSWFWLRLCFVINLCPLNNFSPFINTVPSFFKPFLTRLLYSFNFPTYGISFGKSVSGSR